MANIVSALKIYLSSEGYTIFEAYTGRQALEIAREHQLHLILMDIMMPEMDGISATAKLREEYNVPIILLTAKSEDTDKVLGLNVGADDYITKPFNPIEVVARVRSQLRRYTTLGGMEQKPSKLVTGGIVRLLSCFEAGRDGTRQGSILYPSPHTTFRYLGLEGSISSFSRRWRIWTATAPSEPKAVSFHTCS